MLFYITLLFAIGLVGGNSIGRNQEEPEGRIVGGQNADIREFPFQVSIQYMGQHMCGGSIIESDVVVTAAHCLDQIYFAYLTVAAGSAYYRTPQQRRTIKYSIKHYWYNKGTHDYDIALLFLDSKFNFNNDVKPIKLARYVPIVGTRVTVTGWGHTRENGSNSDWLQKVDVKMISGYDCQRSYPREVITNRMVCAGDSNGGKDSCQNDSGGPLIYNNQLLGVVSWGYGCARKGQPGVYASVPNLYYWIEDNVGNGDL